MKYRKLIDDDYSIGVFLQDSPEAVAQVVKTRLNLWTGEWFLDTEDGTPWLDSILGFSTNYDLEIKERILDTLGVNSIINYSSSLSGRDLIIDCTIDTIYGQAYINSTINVKG